MRPWSVRTATAAVVLASVVFGAGCSGPRWHNGTGKAAPGGSATGGRPVDSAGPIARRSGPPSAVDTTGAGRVKGLATLVGDLVVTIDDSAGKLVGGRTVGEHETNRCQLGTLTAAPVYSPDSPVWTAATAGGASVAVYCAVLKSPRPVVTTGDGPDALILVPAVKDTPAVGINPEQTELGVAAFGQDGKLRWRVPVAGDFDSVTIVLAGPDVVVLDAVPTPPRNVSERHDRTMVLATKTGSLLWQRDRFVPVALDGSRVVGDDEGGSAGALDAQTGRLLWSEQPGRGGEDNVVVACAGGGLALLNRFLSESRIVDDATGALVFDVDQHQTTRAMACLTDGATAFVCAYGIDSPNLYSSEFVIFGVDLRSRQRTWTIGGPGKSTGLEAHLVVEGRLFVQARDGVAIVDVATGMQLSVSPDDNLPPDQIVGAYAVARDISPGNGGQTLIYRVR
jgi:hypothetical protein